MSAVSTRHQGNIRAQQRTPVCQILMAMTYGLCSRAVGECRCKGGTIDVARCYNLGEDPYPVDLAVAGRLVKFVCHP